MTTRVFRLGLALIVAMFGLPALALVASAASTADLACPNGSERLADFALQGDGFVATTGAASVSVSGSGSGGTFGVVDSTNAVIAVLVAGPDGPVATKIDDYPGGTTAGSFDSASFVTADGTPATVTSVSFCGRSVAVSSAVCQDQPVFSYVWDGAVTFSVTLAGTRALCTAVEFHAATYLLDFPAGWDGQPFLRPGATPQTELDHQLILFGVGDEPGTRTVTVAAPTCGPYQADLYTGPRRTTIDASGHGTDFLRGGLLAGEACAEPTPGPTSGPDGGPTPGPTSGPTGPEVEPEGEPEPVSASAAVDCARSALVLTLSNRGAGAGSGPAVEFTVDGVPHVVPVGENRSLVVPVARDAEYRVLVGFLGDSQTFSGALRCAPFDSGSSSTFPPGETGGPDAGPPSAANVPGGPRGPAGEPDFTAQAGAVPAGTAGSDNAEAALAAAEGTPIGARRQGSAAATGSAFTSSGHLAATGPPNLVTASMAASGLLAVGAGLFLVGRSRPGGRVRQ